MAKNWLALVDAVANLSSSEFGVLRELATEADAYGRAVCGQAELAGKLRCSRRTVIRCLATLEFRGILQKIPRRNGNRRGVNEYNLLLVEPETEHAPATVTGNAASAAVVDFGLDFEAIRDEPSAFADPSNFSKLLKTAAAAGYKGEAADALALVVITGLGERVRKSWSRLASLIQGVENLSRSQLIDHLYSMTWEAIVTNPRVLEAKDPWSYLHEIVRHAYGRDLEAKKQIQGVDDDRSLDSLHRTHAQVGEIELKAVTIEMLDEPRVKKVVDALIGSGLSVELVRRASKRVLDLALEWKPDMRITAARRDEYLKSLGLSTKAAGLWMTIFVGTRSDTSGSILSGHYPEEILQKRCRQILRHLSN